MATPQPDPNNPPATNPTTTPFDDQPPQRKARGRPEGCGIWVAILVAVMLIIAILARPDDTPVESTESRAAPAVVAEYAAG